MSQAVEATVQDVRARVDMLGEESWANLLRTEYLFAGRVSEVVGRAAPSDEGTTPRGPRGTDVRVDQVKVDGDTFEAAVFTVRTAKRGGRLRYIALPLAYDPWYRTVLEYFQEMGDAPVFPITRQKAHAIARDAFAGLYYRIDRYGATSDGEDVEGRDGKMHRPVEIVDEHLRLYALHALRHTRASELVEYYGFDGFDLSLYGGWTYQTMARVSTVMNRYLSVGWQKYFPKLLKARSI